MNEEKHWNAIGKSYDGEIFDVFKSNKGNKLQRYFKRHQNKKHRAIDFGCGTGKAFEYMAPFFKEVLAIDISQNLLDIAKTSGYKNISYKRGDLTKSDLKLALADFAFCCNVAILSNTKGNFAIIRNIEKSLHKNGTALLVIPSLESVLYATSRMIEWYGKEGTSVDEIPINDLDYYRSNRDFANGIIYIDNVPTKHYLEPEIRAMLSNTKLQLTALDKLEYSWKTEFESPPNWIKEPFPWDWLVECKKK